MNTEEIIASAAADLAVKDAKIARLRRALESVLPYAECESEARADLVDSEEALQDSAQAIAACEAACVVLAEG